jgi:hypothetical protein
MLVSINEVANRLKISNRAVQIKCKKQGVLKIGNQYQLTEEIAQRWYDSEGKIKRSEQEVSRVDSYAKRKKNVSLEQSVMIYIFLAVIIIFASVSIFFLWLENTKKDKTILDKEKIIMVKDSELKIINKQLDDSVQVINKLRIQSHDLIKDTIRQFKP